METKKEENKLKEKELIDTSDNIDNEQTEVVDELNDNTFKYRALVNKEIIDLNEDYIGIDNYIESIESAIDENAKIICINSTFGGGKSSICSILKKSKKISKKSSISLWDVSMDAKRNLSKIKGEMATEKANIDIMSFYSSFLCQLSADFKSIGYSKYVNKVLNKSTTLFKMVLRKASIWILSLIALVSFSLAYLCQGINSINWKWLSNLEQLIGIDFNKNILTYGLIFIGIINIFWIVYYGGVIFSTWKDYKTRILKIQDVTELYVEIISDSISIRNSKKKNLIIIEDIDRCTDDSETIRNFITSIVKLLHFNCKNRFKKKKLDSIVLIFCIDENRIIKNEEMMNDYFLKIFDYQLDIGKIHFEDFTGIFNKLMEEQNINKKYAESMKVLLNNENNNLRLLKKEINDCLVKYGTLINRFNKNKYSIKFESCVAYSYLKNNFLKTFNLMLKKPKECSEKIMLNIECVNRGWKSIYDVVDSSNNEMPEIEKIEIKKFNKKIKEFIDIGYINEDFKLYFYNYPKYEKCQNIYENYFWEYIKGKNELDLTNNEKLTDDFILECVKKVKEIKMKYPITIVDDIRVFKIILNYSNEISKKVSSENNGINLNNDYDPLYELFSSILDLQDSVNIKKSIALIQKLIDNNIDYQLISKYMNSLYVNQWSKGVYKNSEFYEFREIFTRYVKDEIFEYNKLFIGDFNSISYNEFLHINTIEKVKELINFLKFNEDCEDILLKIKKKLIPLEKRDFCNIWMKNIVNAKKYVEFACDTLLDFNKYDNMILKSIEPLYGLVYRNKKFKKYLNNIVPNSSLQDLLRINEHNIYFGLSLDSIRIFLKNKILKTPLLCLLKLKNFDEIISYDFGFQTIFKLMMNKEFEHLNYYVCEFKKYLLYNSETDKFNYLFLEDTYIKKYKIQIEEEKIINHDLFVLIRLKDN